MCFRVSLSVFTWFCIGLIKKLQKVQNAGLRCICGAFKTTPCEALPLLAFQPPLYITIRKLCDSSAIRFFRLPLSSEISLRLPSSHIPHDDLFPLPIHIPFKRPTLLTNSKNNSFLSTLSKSIAPDTERSEPFHSHNAPYAFTSTTSPFARHLRSEERRVGKECW